MTAIVIPAADVVPDAANLLGGLLFSLEKGDYIDHYPVYVCFDACAPEFVQAFVKNFPWIRAVINIGNRRNFAGNANLGLREAKSDAVVVNQDCVLPNRKYFDKLRGRGIVVPVSSVIVKEPPLEQADLNLLNSKQVEEPQYSQHLKLIGFCMYLSKELQDKVGFFDESFLATFEDDDICARALLAGFPVEHISTLFVHHYGSRCGAYDGARLAINLMKFRVKWQVPVAVAHADFNAYIKKYHKWDDSMREE